MLTAILLLGIEMAWLVPTKIKFTAGITIFKMPTATKTSETKTSLLTAIVISTLEIKISLAMPMAMLLEDAKMK